MTKSFPLFLFLCSASMAVGQIRHVPFHESFDSSSTGPLPVGWTTSTRKNASGDFAIIATSSRSTPNAAACTDATKEQWIALPALDLLTAAADSLEFYERRTSTFQARVLVEAAILPDTSFGIRIARDSLRLQSSSAYVRRIFAMPETLQGHMNVRVRIRCIADSSGTSGVYRIDDVRIGLRKTHDLALARITVSPPLPRAGDDVTVTMTVKNTAVSGTFAGSISLFDSLNSVAVVPFSTSIGAGETLAVMHTLPKINGGRHPLRGVLSLAGDEDSTNNAATTVFTAGYSAQTMTINEVMYAPPAGSPEWVEVQNTSSDTLLLSGWRAADGGTTRALILPPGRRLAPGAYAVITTDTVSFRESFATTADLFQASFSTLNNSGDAVVLFDPSGAVCDSLWYLPAWGGNGGRSLERIETLAPSTAASNWRSSVAAAGSTPGRINSVTTKQNDLAVRSATTVPLFPSSGIPILLRCNWWNAGKEFSGPATVRCYRDVNGDSLFTADERIDEQISPSIAPGDSAVTEFSVLSLPAGPHRMQWTVTSAVDDDTTNNVLRTTVIVGTPPHSIAVNEVMYAPQGDDPEWIEIVNITSDSVMMTGWSASDNGTTRAVLEGPAMALPPGGYAVITTDTSRMRSSIPADVPLYRAAFSSLNNTTPDAVVIRDGRGAVMDSIVYHPAWGGMNGMSLQRFDARWVTMDSVNWNSGPPTPGSENGNARKEHDLRIRSVTAERTGGSFHVRTVIENRGRSSSPETSLRLYRDANGDARASADELIAVGIVPPLFPFDSSVVELQWTITGAGLHPLLLQSVFAEDERPADNGAALTTAGSFAERTLVINEVLYEPAAEGSEFVEVYNRSNDTVDVTGWMMMDQPGSTGNRARVPLDLLHRIPPRGFAVIATDSVFFREHPDADSTRVIIASSLNLSNSGEDLVLTDLTGAMIDSVRYSPAMHSPLVNHTGRSLERISPDLPATDPRNWNSSVAPGGSSPLRTNSILTRVPPQKRGLSLSPNPFSPDGDGHEDFLGITIATGTNGALVRIRIYDTAGRLERRLVSGDPVADGGTVLWDGRDDSGRTVRPGMHILAVELLRLDGTPQQMMKEIAVVAWRR